VCSSNKAVQAPARELLVLLGERLHRAGKHRQHVCIRVEPAARLGRPCTDVPGSTLRLRMPEQADDRLLQRLEPGPRHTLRVMPAHNEAPLARDGGLGTSPLRRGIASGRPLD